MTESAPAPDRASASAGANAPTPELIKFVDLILIILNVRV
jgi:hypothetical protein